MAKMKLYDWILIVIVLIGAINWGLMGLFRFNLVEYLTQGYNVLTRVIYTIVGASALISIIILARKTRR